MFFSIIIPVYNVAPYLRECLDSVLAQTFTDWETICVDDGSTDGSGAILDEYAARDKRFRVIHQPNAGVSAARNKALDVAHGEWLCFLDADDKVECHWLEDIANGAKRHPEADWIRTSFRNWIEGKEPQPWPEHHANRYVERSYDDLSQTVWNMLAHCCMMVTNVFKMEKAKDIYFIRKLKYCEDVCFTLDYIMKSKSSHILLTIPNDDYRYRRRISSANGNMRVDDVLDAYEIILEKWNAMRGKRGAFSPAIERHFFRCINNGHAMTKAEAHRFRTFLWKASNCGFYTPFWFSSKKKQIRWLLFMIFGDPRMLFGKMGLNWLLPNKWAEEEKR